MILKLSGLLLLSISSSSAFSIPPPLTSRVVHTKISHVPSQRNARTSYEPSKGKDVATLDVDNKISSYKRLLLALPQPKTLFSRTSLDNQILSTALPSMLNLAVVPLVNSVDTFWVGRMGNALALAGQGAANQVFFSLYFLVAFLPTLTAPLVAKAVGEGDFEEAKKQVCESLFLSNVLGLVGCLILTGMPRTSLGLVLPPDAAAMEFAIPYLRWRALGMIPALFASTGFAAYRGLLNTVTPLKVSLVTNGVNLLLDPIFIFGASIFSGLGVAGAALATAVSETLGGLIYARLLFRRKLVSWVGLLSTPKWSSLKNIIAGGAAILARQLVLNISFITAAGRAQSMDPTGVMAAAYGIVMQIYSMGIVVHLAIQGTAAALVPSAKATSGTSKARNVADRIFIWGSIIGILLGVTQLLLLPVLVPLFSTLPEVQEAVKAPALISSLLHVINGPVFAGEGTMLGLGSFKALATITTISVSIMVALLKSPMAQTLNGVLLSIAAFSLFQSLAVVVYHVRIGPLRRRGKFEFFGKGKVLQQE